MSYWKGKVLPRIKRYFRKGKGKGAAEAAKSFDESKEMVGNEIQEKKAELEPKVVEIYKDCKPESKVLLKEPTEDGVKTHAQAAQDLLQRLVEIGFPGASVLKEAGDKYGVFSFSVQINFLFEKISPFVANEEPPVMSKDIDVVEDKGSVEAIAEDTIVSEKKEVVSEIVMENSNQPTETVIKTSVDLSEEKDTLAT